MRKLLLVLALLIPTLPAAAQSVPVTVNGYYDAVALQIQVLVGPTLPSTPFLGHWYNATDWPSGNDPAGEDIYITGIDLGGTRWTILRGVNGTTPQSHTMALKQYKVKAATPIPTNTATQTATSTATNTATPTQPPVKVVNNCPAGTCTPVIVAGSVLVIFPTDTKTPTPTKTGTPTNTASSTATNTQTPTFTDTATNTPTDSATSTPTNTGTPTPTNTPTVTNTFTPTPTFTVQHVICDNCTPEAPMATIQNVRIITDTPTNTPTPTNTGTPTNTPTNSATQTPTSTATSTWTFTSTITNTPTPVYTVTSFSANGVTQVAIVPTVTGKTTYIYRIESYNVGVSQTKVGFTTQATPIAPDFLFYPAGAVIKDLSTVPWYTTNSGGDFSITVYNAGASINGKAWSQTP